MSDKVSPLAPKTIAKLPPVAGVRFATYAAGIRYQGRDDVMVAEFAPGTTVGGVFTQSLTASVSVEYCRAHREHGRARALVVNSGNSNAFTGKKGVTVVEKTIDAAVAAFGCARHEVFMSSTGTIGVPPPVDKLTGAVAAAKSKPSQRWTKMA